MALYPDAMAKIVRRDWDARAIELVLTFSASQHLKCCLTIAQNTELHHVRVP